MKFKSIVIGGVIGGVVLTVAGALALLSAMNAVAPPNPKSWDWMEGTTWYVGLAGLPNQIYSTTDDTVQPGLTQTVYRLDSCRYGYFHGLCRVQMPGAPSMCQNLIGCVTPEGDVQLTFLAIDDEGNVQQRIDARGVMRRHQGEWVMENQMTAAGRDDPTTYVTHWAYMLQTKPGDASWSDLPMVHVSVPKFLSDCQMGDR